MFWDMVSPILHSKTKIKFKKTYIVINAVHSIATGQYITVRLKIHYNIIMVL